MSSKHRRGRHVTAKGSRVTAKGTRPASQRRHADDEPDLLAEIGELIATGEPLDLLAFASTMVAAFDPRSRDPFERAEPDGPADPSIDELVTTFGEVERPETSALLASFAVLVPNELVRARARRLLAARADRLPTWLAQLDGARVERAVEMVHVLGDGENLVLELDLPSGAGRTHALSVAVYIDHNLGSPAKDGFVVDQPLSELVEFMRDSASSSVDAGDFDIRPVELGEARARIAEAIEIGSITVPRFESETWPSARPIVEWALRLCPAGGTVAERPRWDEASRAAVAEAFFASGHGRDLDDADHRGLFESLLWFATDYGPGDPLRWSSSAVEIFLADWVPRKVVAPSSYLAKMPGLLRAFVAYSHEQRGIRAGLTEETLATLEELEPEYQAVIRSPRPQGIAALLAAMGEIDPNGPWEAGAGDLFSDALATTGLAILERAVGGAAALEALDDEPLPDEAFDWGGIPDDIRLVVGEVLAGCDRCCEQLLDLEYRTACRRLLARVARNGPDVFRRKGRTDTAAAALCWAVGTANERFSASAGGLRVKDLVSHFGLGQSSASQRALTLLRAAGIEVEHGAYDLQLGSPDLLVGARRRRILERRDRLASTS